MEILLEIGRRSGVFHQTAETHIKTFYNRTVNIACEIYTAMVAWTLVLRINIVPRTCFRIMGNSICINKPITIIHSVSE
jgi:hypothetical protein